MPSAAYRVLAVLEDEAHRRGIVEALESFGSVDWVAGPDEALDFLEHAAPHVVVLGPEGDGASRMAVASAAARASAVVLCLGTDDTTQDQRDEALALGARAWARLDDRDGIRDGLARAVEARRSIVGRREDYRRVQFQYEQLKELSARQSRSFQESQETFYLDLSRMMTIIGNIMDGILFVDGKGSISLLNPVAEDMLGVKAFLAIGKTLDQLEGSDELLAALTADHARLTEQSNGKKEIQRTVEVHHGDQDLVYLRLQTIMVRDYRGEDAGVLSVIKDVTTEHKSDQLKNQYLSIVAHELRTPLTGIKTFSTMMAKGRLGDLNEQQQRVVDSIREQSLRLEHQIDKLINLGHLESENYGQDLEEFDLREFMVTVTAPFEQPAKDRKVELRFDVHLVPDVQLAADRTDLRRACQALVENAVKFARDGGVVEVRVDEDAEGGFQFSVSDNGIGVDPRYHRRIFEKFFQVEDPLTRHHGGAGLGLFVAQGIVQAHGSQIRVDSSLGDGATFSFALPVHIEAGAADDELIEAES